MREVAVSEIESWSDGVEFALHPRMQAITLEVILRAVFGVTDEKRRERLRVLLPKMLDSTSSVSLQFRVLISRRFGRTNPLAFLRELSDEIDELLFAEIAERRADPELEQRQDILSLLALARFEDGEGMTDRELRDQLLTLLLAGHETTATALAWTADLLTRQPQAMQRLTAEVDSEDGDAYLRATISESLRLRPVVPLAGRRLTSELQVNGWTLPAGTDVTPAIWLTHTRADLYPDPYAFRPERFLDERPTTYGWVPFGGGVRRCLGAAFAEFEMRVVLTELLRRRTLQAVSSDAERVTRRNVTFSPRHGTRVTTRVRARPSGIRTSVQNQAAGAPPVGSPAA
jgi:cytochrome P450 family 135